MPNPILVTVIFFLSLLLMANQVMADDATVVVVPTDEQRACELEKEIQEGRLELRLALNEQAESGARLIELSAQRTNLEQQLQSLTFAVADKALSPRTRGLARGKIIEVQWALADLELDEQRLRNIGVVVETHRQDLQRAQSELLALPAGTSCPRPRIKGPIDRIDDPNKRPAYSPLWEERPPQKTGS